MIWIALVEDDMLYERQLKEFLARWEQERGERLRPPVFHDGS